LHVGAAKSEKVHNLLSPVCCLLLILGAELHTFCHNRLYVRHIRNAWCTEHRWRAQHVSHFSYLLHLSTPPLCKDT